MVSNNSITTNNSTTTATTTGIANSSFSLASWLLNNLVYWLSALVVVISILTLLLTRSGSDQISVDEYYDDITHKLLQNIDFSIKRVWNPLFRKIPLFECDEDATYEVSGLELGTDGAIFVDTQLKKKTKKHHVKVLIAHKSLLKERQITKVKAHIECVPDVDYHANVEVKFQSGNSPSRMELINRNKKKVKHILVRVPSIADLDALRRDSKVYDIYRDGKDWCIIVEEIGAGETLILWV